MTRKYTLPIGTTEELNTALPVSNLPPGSLIAATDTHTRYWGPKRGSAAFTQAQEGPGTAALYNAITQNYVTSGAYGYARSYEDAFRDLGTKCTLDIFFRLEDIAYASAVNGIGLHGFQANGSGAGIDVDVRGGAHTDHERIRVTITTAPTRGTAAASVSMTGTTRISYGTGQTNKHHARVVRDGTTATLYLDGVQDAQMTILVANNPINGVLGQEYGQVLLGYSGTANIPFKGHIYGASLRDGSFSSQPIENRMICSPWARNTHYCYLGRQILLGSAPCFFDAGRYGVHAPLHYGAGDYTITAANDNAAPIPSTVQGLTSWTTLTNRSVNSVMCGGLLDTTGVS